MQRAHGTHTHVQVCALETTPPKHCFAEEDVQEVREHTVAETGVVLLQQIVEDTRESLLHFRLRGIESGGLVTCSGAQGVCLDRELNQANYWSVESHK